jgi:hypothetical protein
MFMNFFDPKFTIRAGSLLALILVQHNAIAQYKAFINESTTIKFSLPIKDSIERCNIQLSTDGWQPIEQTVEAPSYVASIEVVLNRPGDVIINWTGKTKFRGLRSVSACPGQGNITISAIPNYLELEKAWHKVFSEMTTDRRECVEIGLATSSLKWQAASASDPIVGPRDQSIMPIYQKCDTFEQAERIWKQWQRIPGNDGSQFNYRCVIQGIATRCDGFYAERLQNGELREITKSIAINNHFRGISWTTGHRENSAARVARETREAQEEEKRLRAEIDRRRAEDEVKRMMAEQEARARVQKENEEREALLARQRIEQESRAARLASEEQERLWRQSEEYRAKEAEQAKIAEAAKKRKEQEQKTLDEHWARVDQERIRREQEAINKTSSLPPDSPRQERSTNTERTDKEDTTTNSTNDRIKKELEELERNLKNALTQNSQRADGSGPGPGWYFRTEKDDFTGKTIAVLFRFDDTYFCLTPFHCSEPKDFFGVQCVITENNYLPTWEFKEMVIQPTVFYRFDNDEPRQANLATQHPDGKGINFWRESEFITKMNSAKTLRLRIVDYRGKTRTVTFDLTGFGRALRYANANHPCK